MHLIPPLLILLFFDLSFSLIEKASEERVLENFRLPNIAYPTHYTIKILTYLSDDFRFDGEVWIDFFVMNETNSLTINQKNLNIFENETRIKEIVEDRIRIKKDVQFTKKYNRKRRKYPTENELSSTTPLPPVVSEVTEASTTDKVTISTATTLSSTANDSEVAVATTDVPTTVQPTEALEKDINILYHDHDSERQFLTVTTNKPLVPGTKYRLFLSYRGFLSDSLTGFYRVAYTKKNKKLSWLASTLFEPIEARAAFPCFDEPEYKATFDIVLGHSEEYRALSNMPLKTSRSIEGKPGWIWENFKTTPKMSTYLVAFVISDLENLSTNDTQYKFWARKDVLHKTRYASKIVPKMKNHLEEVIGVKDPLPKIDFVAIPGFISHALENWGLISFSEKGLLFSPGFTSILNKYETTRLLGHELAHLWFGNSLTPKWWDQIWLNEGISNFLEVEATDHIQPDWDAKTYSAVSSYLRVFSIDALMNTHPLVPKFKTLNDVNDIFDSIIYQKGYYLTRMLNYTLGEETFFKGLRKYVERNQLSTVEENDLWRALTEQGHQDGTLPSEFDLSVIMRAWTRDAGYPVITVERDYINRTASLSQKRFVRPRQDYEFRSNSNGSDENVQKWYIPVTYTSGKELKFNDAKPQLWLTPDEEVRIIENIADDDDFILFNIHAAGLYRVNYDYDNWALIVDHLLSENYTKIAVINRVQIVDDLLDFARSGLLSYQQALDATKYLRQEKHYLPWRAALSNFEYISRMLRSTDSAKIFKKFMRTLVQSRYEELGFEGKKNESLFESMNRKQIIKWACRTGHRDCTRKSVNMFKKWAEEKKPDENNPIPSNLRSVVYCTAIEQGGARDWQFLWQRYLSNTVVTDKAAIITGLGCSKNVRTLKKYLDWSLKETSGIKKQDTTSVFKSVAGNDIGFPIAKNFLKDHINDYIKYIGNSGERLNSMIDTLAKKMNQQRDLNELDEMVMDNKSNTRTVIKYVSQANEKVNFNIDWLQRNHKPITDWLKFQTI